MTEQGNSMRYAWTAIFVGVLAWSAISPHDYPTWWLEVLPALIGGGVLWYTRYTFPLTQLTYVLILIHSIILMVGGHYTYAEVPLFDWIGETLNHTRNNYDKLGHFVQGFILRLLRGKSLFGKTFLTERAGVISSSSVSVSASARSMSS